VLAEEKCIMPTKLAEPQVEFIVITIIITVPILEEVALNEHNQTLTSDFAHLVVVQAVVNMLETCVRH
jgi:hypothetical protein